MWMCYVTVLAVDYSSESRGFKIGQIATSRSRDSIIPRIQRHQLAPHILSVYQLTSALPHIIAYSHVIILPRFADITVEIQEFKEIDLSSTTFHWRKFESSGCFVAKTAWYFITWNNYMRILILILILYMLSIRLRKVSLKDNSFVRPKSRNIASFHDAYYFRLYPFHTHYLPIYVYIKITIHSLLKKFKLLQQHLQ